MTISFRTGELRDCDRLAEFDYLSSEGAVEFLFHDLVEGLSPAEIVAAGLKEDKYPFTFRSAIVAAMDDDIIGMAMAYPAAYHGITEEMRDLFPADRLAHFHDFFSTRVDGSYYLDALYVDEKYRGKGIGTNLIDLTKQSAGKQGFDTLSLIVFSDNIAARRLYERQGFEIVRNIDIKPHPLLHHSNGGLLMKAPTK